MLLSRVCMRNNYTCVEYPPLRQYGATTYYTSFTARPYKLGRIGREMQSSRKGRISPGVTAERIRSCLAKDVVTTTRTCCEAVPRVRRNKLLRNTRRANKGSLLTNV